MPKKCEGQRLVRLLGHENEATSFSTHTLMPQNIFGGVM